MQTVINFSKNLGLTVAMLASVAMPFAAHAADFGDTGWSTTGYTDYTPSYSSYDSGSSNTGWSTTGYTDYTPSYSSNDSGNTGWTTTGYTDYTTPSYDSGNTGWTTTGYTDYTTPTYTTSYGGGSTYYISTGGGGGSHGCYSNCGYVPPTPPAPTCTITANSYTINKGQSVTISWSSTNAVRGNIQNLGSNLAASGSYTLYPTQTTTYSGTFWNSAGQQVNCSTTVNVTVPTPVTPSCTLTVSNYGNNYNNGYWNPNSPVTLTWNSNNANYGSINNGIGSVSTSGSRTIYPNQTTTYTGTFWNYNGQSVTCSATVYVNGYYPPVNPPIYPNTPYVTLSQTPYTGLDLGPVGTVVYWGFIVFWCLLAAYLIAVKKVHNAVYASLTALLFGKKTAVAAAHSNVASSHTAYAAVHEDKTDDFILSQINRVRA